jgi:copper chaperone NosL
MKSTPRLTILSRALLVVAALSLCISIFVPIWKIDLDAPQYPEGLRLLIYADKLGGNVDIINGLNHYIGMKTLHAEEFVEFIVLPWIIGAFAILCLIAAIIAKRKFLVLLFVLFALFGVVAMYDFWRWEYDYGHNLDPNAAIIVPGQAYQPPLIGFKQLLNFGAYSVPALGGWLFVASGLLMLACIFLEKKYNKKNMMRSTAVTALLLLLLPGCGSNGPEPIRLNTDNCDYCKMTISDARFAAELVTAKGRAYKFDDLSCLVSYIRENEKAGDSRQYVCDYNNPGTLIEAAGASYVRGGSISSPMGGNTAALSNADSAVALAGRAAAERVEWSSLKP